MIRKEKKIEEQNEYAENVKSEIIYILDAESGKKGYFCIGCKGEMQAVKTKIEGRKSYFRHDVTDIKKNERECTFSNENYRHSQAMSILNRIKKIKVPTLYKYPPKNLDGKTIKIKNSEFITANYTKSELTFYETDNGDVKFGINPKIDNRNLLIRPDLTFFNKDNEPILLIEIVVTHKIDSEKLAKIKRLGINTVQVTIPKNSLENIEKSFSIGEKIKWIYNYEEERTKYIYIPNDNTEGISQIDELQRKIFDESFECRKSQINNLIRAIRKSLESEQYRELEENFRREIFRVENNTTRAEEKLNDYREGIRNQVERKFEPQRNSIKKEERILDEKERKNDQYLEENQAKEYGKGRELEERYLKRRREINREQREIEELSYEIRFFEATEIEYQEQQRKINETIEQTEKSIRRNLESRKSIPERFKTFETKLRTATKEEERELEYEFKRIRESRIEQITNEDYKDTSKFTKRLREIFNTRNLFIGFDEKYSNYERHKKAVEYFRDGTYKNWNDHK